MLILSVEYIEILIVIRQGSAYIKVSTMELLFLKLHLHKMVSA